VEEIKGIRKEWRRDKIRRELRHPELHGVPLSRVRPAALAVARDPESHSPGRLRHYGPWWKLTADGETTTAVPWCGHCNERTRRLEHPDTRDDDGPCPRCHWGKR
jgi:hypothetical protein